MNHFSRKISAIKIHENQNISKHRNPVNEIIISYINRNTVLKMQINITVNSHGAINNKSSFYVIKKSILTWRTWEVAYHMCC